ncbi:MAG: 50S ribosomal protein L32e [Candidatus Odinarchaeota archaeon]|nr:50S ribosomal protein L32e [Candidatus Odinarchaeota archaeon]
MLKEKLLELRKKIKSKKPDFVRYESWRYKRVKPNWRKPKGIDSKVREKRKGWIKMPDVGYRSPKVVRGLHPSGFEEVLVYRPEDLEKLDPTKHAVRIAHTVGTRKRLAILEKAEELELVVLNPTEEVRRGEIEESEEIGI